jgi:succinate dehydrogenase / fumarate reductase, flavoprotein subunit
MYNRHEMLDLSWSRDARKGIVTRNLVTGEIERWAADAVCSPPAVTATSSSSPPTPAGCNVTAAWRAYKKGAAVRQPLLHPDPPDLHPRQAATTSRSSP